MKANMNNLNWLCAGILSCKPYQQLSRSGWWGIQVAVISSQRMMTAII